MKWCYSGFLTGAMVCAFIAGCAASPSKVLDEGARSRRVARQALIAVAPHEIQTPDYPVVFLPAPTGSGGAIGLAIRSGNDNEHIQPLRDALVGYDFSQPAVDATKQVLHDISWLGVTTVDVFRTASATDIRQWLDRAQTPEVLLYSYQYAVADKDFGALELHVSATILSSKVSSGNDPQDRFETTFSTQVVCRVELDDSKSQLENAYQWGANDAAFARQGLQTCLTKVSSLMERAFNATPEELKAFENNNSQWLRGARAYKVDNSADGDLLYVPLPNLWFFTFSAQLGAAVEPPSPPPPPPKPPMVVTVPFPLSDANQRASGQWSDPSILSDLAARRTDGVSIADLQMRGKRSGDGASLHIDVRGKVDNAPGQDKRISLKFEVLDGDKVLGTGSIDRIKAPETRTKAFEGGFELPVAALPQSSALTMRLTLVDYDD